MLMTHPHVASHVVLVRKLSARLVALAVLGGLLDAWQGYVITLRELGVQVRIDPGLASTGAAWHLKEGTACLREY